MDMRSLIQFLEVAKNGSYTKAAEKLYLVQPTLSKTIKSLEDELGVVLFQKNGQQIELTTYGERLVRIAKPIVSQFKQIPILIMENVEDAEGELVVMSTPMLAELYLASLIPAFCELYPKIKLRIVESNTYHISECILEGTCDIGFCILTDKIRASSEFNSIPLFTNKEVVVAIHKDHPLCSQKSLTMSDLREEQFNVFSEGHALYQQIIKRCKDSGYHPGINISSSNTIFLLKMTSAGNGITLLPKAYIDQEKWPNLKFLPIAPTFPWTCGIIEKSGIYHPHIQNVFIDYVSEKFSSVDGN